MNRLSAQVLDTLQRSCANRGPYDPAPAHVSVFGSVAAGTADGLSDVDLFVVDQDTTLDHPGQDRWIRHLEDALSMPVHLDVRRADMLDGDEMDEPASLARVAATSGIRLWGRPLTVLYRRWPTPYDQATVDLAWAGLWRQRAADARRWRDDVARTRGRTDVSSLLTEGVASAAGLLSTAGRRLQTRRWPHDTGLADDVTDTIGRVVLARRLHEQTTVTFDETVDLGRLADDADRLHRLLDDRLVATQP